MSLETALFIKDLVATNPQGTDPKSQGDDHLRLIKAVLQSQFPGFTDGVGILKTESQLNAMLSADQGGWGGALSSALATNIDTVPAISRLYGIGPSTTGTLPTGGGVGDILMVLSYSSSHLAQLYFVKTVGTLWVRRSADGAGYSNWVSLHNDTPWQTPTLSGGISNGTPPPRYRKKNELVEFYANLTTSSSLIDLPLLTLPVGFRPLVARTFHGSFTGTNLQRSPGIFSLSTAGVLTATWSAGAPTAAITAPYTLTVGGCFFVG